MTMTTNCTERKKMVAKISELLGIKSEYLGMPTGTYRIGTVTVDRDASITAEQEELEKLLPMLKENGFIDMASEIQELPDNEEIQETVDAECNGLVQLDSEADETEGKSEPVTAYCVSIPIQELTPTTLSNLLILLYARQDLIAAMTQSEMIMLDEELVDLLRDIKPDSIARIQEMMESETGMGLLRGVTIESDRLTLAFPYDEAEPTRWKCYATLMMAIVDRAKVVRHVSAKRIRPQRDELKYCCRSWLLQIGFGVHDKFDDMHALIDHLPGYAAFKSADQMQAHKARYAARRKENTKAVSSENAE